jgi:hypothetical protein
MGRTTYINIFVILHNFFNELSHKAQKHQIELAQADTTLYGYPVRQRAVPC